MHLRPVAVVLILAAIVTPQAAFAQGDWPDDCKLVRVARLPMMLRANHVSISGSINGRDVTLAIDTGGYASGLTREATDNLGLVRHRMNSVLIRDMGGKLADEYVRVDNFRIGNLERGGVDLMVLASFAGFDGLIAPDLLRNYDVELDFGGKEFSLFKHHPCAGRAVYWTGSYAVVPFDVTHDGHIRVPVTLDGQDTYAVIDSGAGLSAISMQSAKRMFGIDADSPNVEASKQLTGASGSQIRAYTYPFKTLTMGGVTVANPRVELAEGSNFLGENDASVLLGMDVLSRLHLYIAYREQKLYITDAQIR